MQSKVCCHTDIGSYKCVDIVYFPAVDMLRIDSFLKNDQIILIKLLVVKWTYFIRNEKNLCCTCVCIKIIASNSYYDSVMNTFSMVQCFCLSCITITT